MNAVNVWLGVIWINLSPCFVQVEMAILQVLAQVGGWGSHGNFHLLQKVLCTNDIWGGGM